tara:strand:+ start:1273 stop:2574 length:1302 start_codon:yes stop_codon:yes gene_type:complete
MAQQEQKESSNSQSDQKPIESYEYHDHKFDQTPTIALNQGVVLDHGKKYRDLIQVWNYKQDDGSVKKVPIPARWHPHSVIKRIVAHNKLGQYTGIVMIGQSGSGKTTLTRKLIHQIHSMGENYIIKWYNGHEMLKMDEHIKSLQVGTPHIMIFDDASYTLEDAKKSEVAKLANALTTIRHTLKSRVIIVMNIHYSKATLKFFRNQHFTFLTSVSVEEMGNYTDLFKDKMHVIRAFGKSYNKMMLRGYFEAPVSSFERTTIRYTTNEPFRVALVAEIADLHFMLYNKDECPACDPKNMGASINMVKRQPNTIKAIMEKFGAMYSDSGKKLPVGFATVLRFYTKIQTGTNTLTKAEKAMWNNLTNIAKGGFTDWEGLLDTVNATRQRKLVKNRHNKIKADATIADIAREVKKEQEAEKLEKPMDTPDYDSTYIPR